MYSDYACEFQMLVKSSQSFFSVEKTACWTIENEYLAFKTATNTIQ